MRPQGDGKSFIGEYIFDVTSVLTECSVGQIMEIMELLIWARERGKKVFTFGNGGSAAAASHLSCDLAKGTINGSRKRFRTICLSDSIPLMTAWANDEEYADIFAQQLDPLLETDDVVFGISGSGNSPNVIRAVDLGNARGAHTAGLTGFDGGELSVRASVSLTVPSDNMQHVEDAHMIIIHLLTSYLRLGSHEKAAHRELAAESLEQEITG